MQLQRNEIEPIRGTRTYLGCSGELGGASLLAGWRIPVTKVIEPGLLATLEEELASAELPREMERTMMFAAVDGMDLHDDQHLVVGVRLAVAGPNCSVGVSSGLSFASIADLPKQANALRKGVGPILKACLGEDAPSLLVAAQGGLSSATLIFGSPSAGEEQPDDVWTMDALPAEHSKLGVGLPSWVDYEPGHCTTSQDVNDEAGGIHGFKIATAGPWRNPMDASFELTAKRHKQLAKNLEARNFADPQFFLTYRYGN